MDKLAALFQSLLDILVEHTHTHLMVLVICYVAMFKKMFGDIIEDEDKNTLYPLMSIIFGVVMGIFVFGLSAPVILTTIAIVSGGVTAVKSYINKLKGENKPK